MKLKLKVLAGPQKGQIFDIKDEIVIGRSRTDIALNDPKVSSKHAKIKKGKNNQWFIEDLGSTNGLKLNGKKVHQVPINPGVRIVLGNSEIEFFEEIDLEEAEFIEDPAPNKARPSSPPPVSQAKSARMVEPEELALDATINLKKQRKEKLSTEPLDVDVDATPDIEIDLGENEVTRARGAEEPGPREVSVVVEEESWQEFFSNFISDIRKKTGSPNVSITPFERPLQLYFKSGIQLDQTWTLGYGPRTAGSKSMDIPILEGNAPSLCFVLKPQKKGVLFSTPNPGTVQLNKKELDSEVLKDGDIISIYNTEIQVKFLNE